MARIPRAAQLGLDPSAAQQTRGIVDIPIPDFSGQKAAAEAVGEVGKAMLEFGNKLQKEKEDHELVKADADMRVRMDKARQNIELDPETPDAALPQRWKQESELIIKDVGGGISSSRARELWEIRARGVQGEGDVWSQNLLRKRQVDKVGGAYITMASEAEAMAGDPSISPETYARKLDGLRALTAQHLATGFIGDEDAAKRVALLESYAVKDNTERWKSNFDALTTQGKIAEAEEFRNTQMGLNKLGQSAVDPKVLEDSKKALDTAKPKYAADAAATDIYGRSKAKDGSFDFSAGLAEARKIADPVVRDLTVTQLGQMFTQDKAAHEQEQDAAAKELFDYTMAGNDPMKAPPSLRSRFDNASRMKSSIALYNSMQAEKGMTPAQKAEKQAISKDARDGLEAFARRPGNARAFMEGPSSWPPTLQAAYKSLMQDDLLAIEGKREQMIQTGPTADATDKVLQDITNAAKRIAPELLDTKDENAKTKFAFEGVLYGIAKGLSDDQGGVPLTADQAKRAALQALGLYDPDAKGAYRITAYRETNAMNAAEIERDDPLGYGEVYTRLAIKKGGVPTQFEVVEAYNKLMRR